jgi:hypothetical protein
MPNGKPGDHPLNDILDHGLGVFSPEADTLVREISDLVPRDRLWDLVDWFSPPPIDEFTAQLTEIRDRLRPDAHDRGWEV